MEEFFKGYQFSATGLTAIATVIGIVISYFTLRAAIGINKQFGKNHIQAKQIDHVCELIEELNKPRVTVTFSTYGVGGGYSGVGDGIVFNIFELGSYDTIQPTGTNKDYEEEVVLFDKDSNQLLDIKKYLDHPLTPRSIVDELLKFYNRSCHTIVTGRDDNHLKNFVLVSTRMWDEKVFYDKNAKGNLRQSPNVTYETWLSLKETSKQLKIVIGNWLIQNGINENNIREDFKHVRV